MATICQPGKDSWPELVSIDGKVAAATIMRENSKVNAIVVEEGTGVPENFSCVRVWVWVSKCNEKVIQTPRIG